MLTVEKLHLVIEDVLVHLLVLHQPIDLHFGLDLAELLLFLRDGRVELQQFFVDRTELGSYGGQVKAYWFPCGYLILSKLL